MHPNPAFRADPQTRHIEFARARAFGVLAISTDSAPLVSHVPYILNDDATWADLHLVRSNPILHALNPLQPARIAVSGPDGYISPDWYEIEDQVPTWNYVAVHLVGELEKRPLDELRNVLGRQTEHFEDRLLPKPPWTTDKMSDVVLDRFMRMIVPCRLHLSAIEGTWKLNQNKPDVARANAADQVEAAGIGSETTKLAALMRGA